MEYLQKVTNLFILQHDKNPFESFSLLSKKLNSLKIQTNEEENNDENEEITKKNKEILNFLPFLDFDFFENSLIPLLNDFGGISSIESSKKLLEILKLSDITNERKGIILEILSNTKINFILNFLNNDGIGILFNWLKV